MSIAWANVVAIAPELSTVLPGTQTTLLAIVDRQIDDDVWLDLANDGRTYLAAHLGTLTRGGAAGGAVIGETLGPMSRQYALPPGIHGALSTTKYGLFYLHLISLLPSSLGFVA